ncbi:MAG TPA: hypothetical protein VFB25_06680 [Gaiellaceae bacterium]|nr:hypothetical protein [Gaiellaceae bacterium]
MATKLAELFRRYPVAVLVVLVALALVAAAFGYHPGHNGPRGFWDGPI